MTESTDPWKVTQIAHDLSDSFAQCACDFERTMWRVYAAKDCKRILNGRKPTPGEQAILDQYGIRLSI